MSNSMTYWNNIWKKEGLDTWRYYPVTTRKICEELQKIQNPSNILELGGGIGLLSNRIERLGHNVVLIDISRQACNIAEETFHLNMRTARVPPIPCDNSSFDWIIAAQFLEHLNDEELDETLQECARVAPNAIYTVPNNILGPAEEQEHHQQFTRETFEELLKKYYEFVIIEEYKEHGETFNLPILLATCKNEVAK